MVNLANGREISDTARPYFIAEMNTSHFGDISKAKDMILAAKKSGADCVKFQSWSANTLYSDEYYKENPIAKRFVKKFSLTNEELAELASYAKSNQIDFSSTPYSFEEAKFLVEKCEVPFVKIASMELNNHVFLKQLASLEAPLILSTGMGTFEEILLAVHFLKDQAVKDLVILHCTSIYPSNPKIINLKNIITLKKHFEDCVIGFSDHSLGFSVPTASIALGACVIEKHFTLDKSQIGMDNGMAAEPDEFKKMVASCLIAHQSMGDEHRSLTSEEAEMALKMRRSVVCKTDMQPDDLITEDKIEFKRPGTGISVDSYKDVIGKKVNKLKHKGDLIYRSDIS
jgi:N-acetylneuraminate synthase